MGTDCLEPIFKARMREEGVGDGWVDNVAAASEEMRYLQLGLLDNTLHMSPRETEDSKRDKMCSS